MKKWIFLLLIVLAGLLQLTFLDYFKFFGLRPDLLLLSAVIASLIFQPQWALFFSAFAGIFKDAFVVSSFGLNTALFALWSFLIVRLTRNISIDNNVMRAGLVFLVAVLQNIASGLIFIYLGGFVPLGIFLRIVLFGSIYTALILPLAVKLIPDLRP